MGVRKPRNNKGILTDKQQIKSCVEFLSSQGYAVFKLGENETTEERAGIEKLKAAGYKVEHVRDLTVKVEPQRISSADDIALYFYERLRRYNEKCLDPDKLKDAKYRLVDCSVINSLVKWRMGEGILALTEAIEDVFIMIDVLFEKAKEWNINIYGVGILSVTHNKPLVLTLLREANIKRDTTLSYEIEYEIFTDDSYNYINLLDEAKAKVKAAEAGKAKPSRRKINLKEN